MPRAIKPIYPWDEFGEHCKLADYLDFLRLSWCHVPNGEPRSIATGAKLKRMGVKPGIPDILIFTPPPRGGYCGVALELKAHKLSKVTAMQRAWVTRLGGFGWYSEIVVGCEGAIKTMRELGYG